MRSQITAHLPEDLAAVYDEAVMRRGEIAHVRLARGVDGPELAAVTAEAEDLDATLETLRNPESTAVELDWVRNWAARTAEAETPAAEQVASEPELEAAI